jgi:hypothetical protein
MIYLNFNIFYNIYNLIYISKYIFFHKVYKYRLPFYTNMVIKSRGEKMRKTKREEQFNFYFSLDVVSLEKEREKNLRYIKIIENKIKAFVFSKNYSLAEIYTFILANYFSKMGDIDFLLNERKSEVDKK